MNESLDLTDLLRSWPYDPERNARLIRAPDGRELLQVRTALGIEQYELEDRPDGLRPHGAESAFDHQLQRLARAKTAGDQTLFSLSSGECAELFTEGTLYYQRYLHLFQLREWGRTLRDTARNLRLFDFVRRHAEREEDQIYLEKWRPYLVRMNAVAGAMIELDKGAHDQALEIVRSTIEQIESFAKLEDGTFLFERKRALMALRELAAQIESNRPVSELEALERDLRHAVDSQEFERAAQLRDQIRALRQRPGRA